MRLIAAVLTCVSLLSFVVASHTGDVDYVGGGSSNAVFIPLTNKHIETPYDLEFVAAVTFVVSTLAAAIMWVYWFVRNRGLGRTSN